MRNFSKLCLAAAVSAVAVQAVTPAIGVATAVGTFTVNSAEVEGNANLFDGAQIRTGKSPSQVYLQNGPAVILGIDSEGAFYRDRLVLERGATRVQNMSGYSIQAAQYRISGEEPKSQAIVRLYEGDVQIAALTGTLRVSNEKGVLLTRVGAGTATSFSQSPSAKGAPINTENRPKEIALYALLVLSMAGLGLATDAILQPGGRSSVSP